MSQACSQPYTLLAHYILINPLKPREIFQIEKYREELNTLRKAPQFILSTQCHNVVEPLMLPLNNTTACPCMPCSTTIWHWVLLPSSGHILIDVWLDNITMGCPIFFELGIYSQISWSGHSVRGSNDVFCVLVNT